MVSGVLDVCETESQQSLQQYICTTTHPSWNELISSFRLTTRHLKSTRRWQKISRKSIFSSLRLSYKDLLWRRLSIDLVAASLRQREFARKITGPESKSLDCPLALSHAIFRYSKFLQLMKRQGPSPHKHITFVPTLDIDLCWHTHQLSPRAYREWCLSHLSRPINHDDTIGVADLDKALRETSLTWLKEYSEGYTTDHLKRKYFSPRRRIAGILFPIYGLYLLYKGRKLEQAQASSGTNSFFEQNADLGQLQCGSYNQGHGKLIRKKADRPEEVMSSWRLILDRRFKIHCMVESLA